MLVVVWGLGVLRRVSGGGSGGTAALSAGMGRTRRPENNSDAKPDFAPPWKRGRFDDPQRAHAVVSPGESPAKRRRRRQNAAAHRARWISVADQKRGFEAALWYQNMSRVCPECPQTNPREAKDGSWIQEAYGERPKSKV